MSVQQDSASLQGAEALPRFASTPNVTRHFYPRCGTHVFTHDARMPHILGIPAGLFPAESMPAARGHYFVSDKASWATLPPNQPCFGGDTGMTPLPP